MRGAPINFVSYKDIFIFIIYLCIFVSAAPAWGQDSQGDGQSLEGVDRSDDFPISKQMMHTIEFGIGAGALVGIADISNFHHDIGANMDTQNIFRGMSYGLYGGILLGIYMELVKKRARASPSDNAEPENGSPDQAPAVPQSQRSFLPNQFLLAADSDFQIEPLFFDGQITGGFVRMQILQF